MEGPPFENRNEEEQSQCAWASRRVRIVLPWQPTAVFLVCKEIYKEASEIFYGQNDIRLRSPHSMTGFVSAIGAIGAISRYDLRKLTVRLGHTPINPIESWPYLTECGRLESLTVQVVQNIFLNQPAARDNCKKLKGLKALLAIRGIKEVDVEMQWGRLGMTAEQETVWQQEFLDLLQVLKGPKKVPEPASPPNRSKRKRGPDEEDMDMEGVGDDEEDDEDSDATASVMVATQPKQATEEGTEKGP
ncbi:MAG: hypothetical protein Q9187_008224 [Circinaria calcarea]